VLPKELSDEDLWIKGADVFTAESDLRDMCDDVFLF
jgi:hypothetical protein